jgi:hypothetical protein
MVELLGYLEANGFSNYGRDFMRPISQEVHGIPRERVIGLQQAGTCGWTVVSIKKDWATVFPT